MAGAIIVGLALRLVALGRGSFWLRAAMAALGTAADSAAAPHELRRQRTRGLAAYVVLGALTLYTHYYAAFLLASVAAVGIIRSVTQRSRHGLVLWIAAHAVIGLA